MGHAACPTCKLSPHRLLLVTDFYYPNVGGVENHVYQLAQCLLALGCKVGLWLARAAAPRCL